VDGVVLANVWGIGKISRDMLDAASLGLGRFHITAAMKLCWTGSSLLMCEVLVKSARDMLDAASLTLGRFTLRPQ
jgi:hypothetical protein